jgi:outer membrane protein OmpA-like peptidoglycan-associated protein
MNTKFFCWLLTVCLLGAGAQAQLNDPNKVVKDAAANHANNDMSNTAESGLNKAENGIKGLFKKKPKKTDAGTPVAAGTAGSPVPAATTGAPANTSAQPAAAVQQVPASVKAYNNYDFVPGDKIVFEDHFTDDAEGEFPTHWELGAGQAVVNKMGEEKVFMLTDGNYCHVKPLMKSPSYLTSVFTIEYDIYMTGGAYPAKLYFYDTDKQGQEMGNINVNAITAEYAAGNSEGKSLSGNMPDEISNAAFVNKWHHVAIAYKNKQIKIYVDQYRVTVIPNSNIVPGAFDIEGIGNATDPIIIKNVRVAQGGGMNMLGKKFTDAKIITHGINFDIDKATIKPESMGTLNMIAGILKDNPEINFEIDGHTDNTGAAAHNRSLSQQRAEAVKTQLLSMGVAAGRLSAKGFGDTKPISDNTSLEGKANNRRVEFVKK